jgi:tetrahydromethanopterin S-methyltransferase subunit G
MLFFKKSSNEYQEVLKTLREMQLKQANLDVKMQETESKLDFMRAELKQQRRKRLGITEEEQTITEGKDINNSVLLPDNGVVFKHR